MLGKTGENGNGKKEKGEGGGWISDCKDVVWFDFYMAELLMGFFGLLSFPPPLLSGGRIITSSPLHLSTILIVDCLSFENVWIFECVLCCQFYDFHSFDLWTINREKSGKGE